MNCLRHAIRLVLVCLLALCAAVFPANGQTENRNITLSVGEIRDLSVPFVITQFEPGNRDIVRVQRSAPQALSVTALKEGLTDLKVVGDANQTATFKITVLPSVDLNAILKEVRKDLDNIPGVEAEIGLGKVVLRGTVTKPEEWAYLKKTILPSYGDHLQCKVIFKLQPELLLKLKSNLEKARFTVLEDNSPTNAPGALNLYCADNNVVINGSVYSPGELASINMAVTSCPWLKIKREGDKDADDACYAVINVAIVPVSLELDATFVGVTDAEATTLGANLLRNGLAFVDAAAGYAGSTLGTVRSGSYVVSGSMSDTVKAISGGPGMGPSRFSSMGHLTFKNDAADWKVFQDGGTIILPVSGGLGTTGSVQPVDYGLILKAKGGLTDANNVSLDLQIELSVPVLRGTSPSGPVYDLERKRVESTVYCPVGKTLIMAGAKQLTEGVNIKSETPILGKIPLLQFLFSERTKSRTARQLLILVSPQIARAPVAAPPLVDQTADTPEKAKKPLSILKNNSR